MKSIKTCGYKNNILLLCLQVNNSRKLSEMMKHHGTLQEPLDCVLVKVLIKAFNLITT